VTRPFFARFLEHIAKMHAHQDHSMHFNSNVLIEFQAKGRALVESYVLVLQRYRARYLDCFGAPGFTVQKHGIDDPLYKLPR